MKPPLIILTGPTAVGKTSLSIQLAKALNGEIISADSMQVYRHMNIGSAKITKEEMNGVPHHLIDVLDPWEEFDVHKFQTLAKQALEEIYSRGHIPIVVGGTGFYIQALLYDIDFKENADNGSIRTELEALGAIHGNEYLHQMLCSFDPESGTLIHANNRKRVIRAIEYYRLTGEPISLHNQIERGKSSPYNFVYYVLTCNRDCLYQRIEQRVDFMIKEGLVAEVQDLKKLGCKREMVSMKGLGYKEILDYLDGICSLEDAINTIKRDTRHFAKRQLTWFKRERDVRQLSLEDFEKGITDILPHILDEWHKIEMNGIEGE